MKRKRKRRAPGWRSNCFVAEVVCGSVEEASRLHAPRGRRALAVVGRGIQSSFGERDDDDDGAESNRAIRLQMRPSN